MPASPELKSSSSTAVVIVATISEAILDMAMDKASWPQVGMRTDRSSREHALEFFHRHRTLHLEHPEVIAGSVRTPRPLDDFRPLLVVASPRFDGLEALVVHQIRTSLPQRFRPTQLVDCTAVMIHMSLDKQSRIETFDGNVFVQVLQDFGQFLPVSRSALFVAELEKGSKVSEILYSRRPEESVECSLRLGNTSKPTFDSRHFGQVVLVVVGEGKCKGRTGRMRSGVVLNQDWRVTHSLSLFSRRSLYVFFSAHLDRR